MYPGKVGRDHLGLGSVSSGQILASLSPGINVLTIHPRYYSFYAFLLDELWQRRGASNRKAFAKFYRPREFVFSLGAYLCKQGEHGDMQNIVGGQKTGSWAANPQTVYDTAVYSPQYIVSDLGGYGLYYRTVMAEVGLLYPGGPGFATPIDVPSEKGREVAKAFRRAVAETTYYQQYFDHDEVEIPIEVIEEYIHQACLCQLQLTTTPDRPLLLDVFLYGGLEETAAARRETFRLFLDIVDQTQEYRIDQNQFRQLVYFGGAGGGATYSPRATVMSTYRRWRLYQAREYYAFALNALWYHLCDWGVWQGGDARPIPISQLWHYVEHGLDFDALAQHLNVPGPRLREGSDLRSLLDWLREVAGTWPPSLDDPYDLQAPIHEHHLYELAMRDRQSSEIMVAGMIALLALIVCRFGEPDLWFEDEWSISRMGAEGRLSLSVFLHTVHQRLKSGPFTIGEFTRWLYADYVILQHQLVATGKLPDNTFRFHREGDRLRFYSLENPLGFMDSRFTALSTTVHELGLCGNFDIPQHPLTPDGRSLLESGDLP